MTPISGKRARPRFRGILAAALSAGVLAVLGASPAAGHGDLESTIPEKNSKVSPTPDHLIINFTEAPTKQSAVSVKDGCGDEVTAEVFFEDKVGHVFLGDAQPGKWKVSYDVVSSVDGHKTDGSYSFTVTGKADCSGATKDSGSDGNGAGPGPQAGGNGEPEDDSSFPIVPVALGSVGLVALALVARRLSG